VVLKLFSSTSQIDVILRLNGIPFSNVCILRSAIFGWISNILTALKLIRKISKNKEKTWPSITWTCENFALWSKVMYPLFLHEYTAIDTCYSKICTRLLHVLNNRRHRVIFLHEQYISNFAKNPGVIHILATLAYFTNWFLLPLGNFEKLEFQCKKDRFIQHKCSPSSWQIIFFIFLTCLYDNVLVRRNLMFILHLLYHDFNIWNL